MLCPQCAQNTERIQRNDSYPSQRQIERTLTLKKIPMAAISCSKNRHKERTAPRKEPVLSASGRAEKLTALILLPWFQGRNLGSVIHQKDWLYWALWKFN